MNRTDLANEWQLHQTQFDSYEKFSLLIKLLNVCLVVLFVSLGSRTDIAVCLVLVLWLLDAIWKTFQGRIDKRLLELEAALAELQVEDVKPNVLAYQFNRNYLKQRPSFVGLIAEYFKQSLRPTVAFPHVVLVALCLYNVFL